MTQSEGNDQTRERLLGRDRATKTVDGRIALHHQNGITTVYWEISVSQSATRSVERDPRLRVHLSQI